MPRLRAVSRPLWSSALVFAGYASIAFAALGVQPLVRHGTQFIGYGYDPQIFIWSLAWWPHAVTHGVNPFFTRAIWSPVGVNLTWSTTIPGLALLFSPLTSTAGATVAYDVAAVLMPALAAWTAFVLCRYLTGSLWASVVGGYLFGFSSFVLAQDGYGGHLNLGSVFLLPLIALAVLQFLDERIGGRGLVVRLGVMVGLQFLFSTEVAFTLTLALAAAIGAAALTVPARRRRIRALLSPLVGAYALAGVLTAPFVYYLLSGGVRPPYYSGPDNFDTDLANFVVPTKMTVSGGSLFTGVSKRYLANFSEEGAYIGLPVLLIVGLFLAARWRTPVGRFLLAALGVALLAALGGRLTVAGHQWGALPWRLVMSLPVFDNVLTDRFVVYITFLSAVVVALWIAARRRGLLRWGLPALGIVAILPNPSFGGFATSYHVPAFFTDSLFRSCLDPGETVLPFPVRGGNALLWQVDGDFRFNLAGGDIGPDIPVSFFKPESVVPVAGGLPLDVGAAGILRTFLAGKNITSIVVDARRANDWVGAIDQIAAPHVVGGVYLYHLTPGAPSCPGG